jgi:hypothetical protein
MILRDDEELGQPGRTRRSHYQSSVEALFRRQNAQQLSVLTQPVSRESSIGTRIRRIGGFCAAVWSGIARMVFALIPVESTGKPAEPTQSARYSELKTMHSLPWIVLLQE